MILRPIYFHWLVFSIGDRLSFNSVSTVRKRKWFKREETKRERGRESRGGDWGERILEWSVCNKGGWDVMVKGNGERWRGLGKRRGKRRDIASLVHLSSLSLRRWEDIMTRKCSWGSGCCDPILGWRSLNWMPPSSRMNPDHLGAVWFRDFDMKRYSPYQNNCRYAHKVSMTTRVRKISLAVLLSLCNDCFMCCWFLFTFSFCIISNGNSTFWFL